MSKKRSPHDDPKKSDPEKQQAFLDALETDAPLIDLSEDEFDAMVSSSEKARLTFGNTRERIEAEFYDTAILRDPPHRLALYPSGWANGDVPQIANGTSGSWPTERRSGQVSFFRHSERIGNPQFTNMVMAGCLPGDQTMHVMSVTLAIRGSRLKSEDYAKFMGTTIEIVCGTALQFTIEPLVQPLVVDGQEVGIYLTKNLRKLISVQARQNFALSAMLPKASWEILDFVEMMRMSINVNLTRDIL